MTNQTTASTEVMLYSWMYCRILTWRGDAPDYSQYRGHAVLVDVLQDPYLWGDTPDYS